MEIDKVNEMLKMDCMREAVLIGNADNRVNYFPAIVEFDVEKGVVVYDYDELAECFAEEFRKSDEAAGPASMEDALSDAYEWVEFNVIRSLPYTGEHAPVVRIRNYDLDADEMQAEC